MNNIITYEQFIREEYGWKSWIGGIIFSALSILPNVGKSDNSSGDPNRYTYIYGPTNQLKLFDNLDFPKSINELKLIINDLIEKQKENTSWDKDESLENLKNSLDEIVNNFESGKNIDEELKEITMLLSFLIDNQKTRTTVISLKAVNIIRDIKNYEEYDPEKVLVNYTILYNELKEIGKEQDLGKGKSLFFAKGSSALEKLLDVLLLLILTSIFVLILIGLYFS